MSDVIVERSSLSESHAPPPLYPSEIERWIHNHLPLSDTSLTSSTIVQHTDCISPTKKEKIPLLPPQVHFTPKTLSTRLSHLTDSLFRLQSEHLQSVDRQIACQTDSLLHEKGRETKKFIEAAEQAHHSNFWDFLKMIAGAILGAVSIVTGASLVALGGPIGWVTGSCLIVSGATAITATTLSELGVHRQVTTIVGLVGAGIGLIGSVTSFFTIANSLPQLISSIINGVMTVGSGVTSVGAAETKRRLSMMEQEMIGIQKQLNGDLFTAKYLTNEATQLAEHMFDTSRQCSEVLASTLRSENQIIHIQG